ncbi:hypothetical protein TrVE_jg5317 [Triparma verrucosa]|uniref:Uncharacterized protein n=1 Tax=Triparma verrucosa TaxID=1606542 RepID=A0A9W7B7X2_9STRA|nr:hypothetical protein TrVE_jg5317 [Triparma verrucosa]
MGQTLLPMHCMIVIVMAFHDPLREGNPYREVLSMFVFLCTWNCEYIREYFLVFVRDHSMKDGADSILLRMFATNIIVILIGRLVIRKRRSLKRMRKKGVRLMVTHFLPISFFSVLISVIYVTAESLGCITRRKIDDIECWDIVASNSAFAQIFVTFFFVANLVLPFRSKRKSSNGKSGSKLASLLPAGNATTGNGSSKEVIKPTDSAIEEVEESFDLRNLMRFKLKFKEQFGLVMFSLAAMVGLFLFASSNEILEIHSLDSSSLAYDVYKKEIKNMEPSEVTSQNLYVRQFRAGLEAFCTVTCAMVILSSFFNNNFKERFGGLFTTFHLHTDSDFEFAPAYVMLMYVMTGIVFFTYVRFAVLVVTDEDKLHVEKFQRYTEYTIPLLFFLVCMIFYSSPRNTTKANTYIYFLVPICLVLKYFSEILLLNNFKRTTGQMFLALVISLFFKVISRSRKYLSLQSDVVLKKHMLSIFQRGATAIGPMVFLYAEAIGCVMNYSNLDPKADGRSDVDCHESRPGPLQAFCDWAKWHTFETIKSNVTGVYSDQPLLLKSLLKPYEEAQGNLELWNSTWTIETTDVIAADPMWEECGWDVTTTHNPKKFYDWTKVKLQGKYSKFWGGYDGGYDEANWNGTLPDRETGTQNWNLVDLCPLSQCDGVGTPNNVVMMHLCFSLMYWVFFGFTFGDLTYDDVASLRPETMEFHLIVQIFAMTAATVVSFFIFGLRSDHDDSLLNIINLMFMFVICCWILCFIAQGMHLRRQHMSTESVATNVLEHIGGLSKASGLGKSMKLKSRKGLLNSGGKSTRGASQKPMKAFLDKHSEITMTVDGKGKSLRMSRTFSAAGKRTSTTHWAKAINYADKKGKMAKVLEMDAKLRKIDALEADPYENPFGVPEDMKEKLERKRKKEAIRSSSGGSGAASLASTKSTSSLRPSTDLVVNIMGWLDQKTKRLIFSSNLKEGGDEGDGPEIAPMFRFLMYVFFLHPFLYLLCAPLAPTPQTKWFRFYLYDITKYMSLQMAVAFCFTSLKKSSFKWDALVWVTFLPAFIGEMLLTEAYDRTFFNMYTLEPGYLSRIWYLLFVYLIFYIIYKGKLSMQKFMSHDFKVGMVVDTGLSTGVASAFIPIIYMTGESVACIWRVSNREGEVDEDKSKFLYNKECSNLTYGVKSICVQSIMVFLYSTAIGPLLLKQTGGIAVSCMARLDIGAMELYQLFNLVTTSMLTLWLFGTRSAGKVGTGDLVLFYALCFLWTIAFTVEAFYRRWEKIRLKQIHVPDSNSSLSMKRVPTKFTDKQIDIDTEVEDDKSESFHKVELLQEGESDDDDMREDHEGVHNVDFSPGLV